MTILSKSHNVSNNNNNLNIDENKQCTDSSGNNGYGNLNPIVTPVKKRQPRPSEVLNTNMPSLFKLTPYGRSNESDQQVAIALDEVFDTVGTDEVESQYFEPQAYGYQPSGS